MAPQKRKADITSPPETSEELPRKRARSENTAAISEEQNGNSRSSKDYLNDIVELSVHAANPLNQSPAALSKENKNKDQNAPPTGLHERWDQLNAADSILMKLKDGTKLAWTRIEQLWERETGERPAEGALQDRYKQLKGITARSKNTTGGEAQIEAVEKSLKSPAKVPVHRASEVKIPSPAISKSSRLSSGAIIHEAKSAGNPMENGSGSPAIQFTPEQDLPQSWVQASPGDQLIVGMRTSRKPWTKIEEAWEKLTGKPPAKGAVQERYELLKDFVMPPNSKHTNTTTNTSDHADSWRAKSMFRGSPKRKARAEIEEESLDEDPDQDLDQDLNNLPKHFSNPTRRGTRGAADELARPNAPDAPSDGPATKREKTTTAKPSDGMAEAGSSDESDEISKPSRVVAKSAKNSLVRPTVAANSGPNDTAQTADEMLVEMREKGCNWVEISQAWTEKTGLTHAPETLRRRYPRIKDGSASKLKSVTSTSNKRDVKAAPTDEVSYRSSIRRSKAAVESPRDAGTPIKRNMDRGKRKSFVKYTDSTTDEDELYAAPTESAIATSTPAKPRAGRAAKINRNDPEWLVTNEKSRLASEDLHAEFSNPKTYENFTKSDWEDLRETLPSNVPFNPDGYSIPITFFKYDPDFRRGIREFQEDLASGRLDPKWQAEAAEAMEARARGDFDAYKEDQFEAFWGQKQKLNHAVLAGESTTIKLDLLIQNEIFKVGDYFSYTRVIGRGKNGVLIEKDCKIVGADGKTLTLAIPPGQRKYSRRLFESVASKDTGTKAKVTTAEADEERPKDGNTTTGAAHASTETPTNGDEVSEVGGKGDEALYLDRAAENDMLQGGSRAQDPDIAPVDKTDEIGIASAENPEDIGSEKNDKLPKNHANESTSSEVNISNGVSVQPNDAPSATPSLREEDEDILHSVSSLNQLEQKIVEIDGRINPKDLPVQNTWKNFRGIRNNQDLGSLFEMREDFFVYKHPKIVKEPKRKR